MSSLPFNPATPPSQGNVSSISQNNPNRGQRPACPRYAKDELTSELQLLKPEFRCLINDFRDWSWANEGIENEPEFLLQLALHFKFSRHRFTKYWPTLSKYFTERDGLLFFERDEKHRQEQIETSDKARRFGRLGGLAKAAKHTIATQSSITSQSTPPRISPSLQLQFQSQGSLQKDSVVQEELSITKPSPLPPENRTGEEGRQGGGSLKKPQAKANTQQSQELVTPEELQTLSKRCAEMGLEPASPILAARLKRKLQAAGFRNWIDCLEKFSDQKSAGLWEAKTITELQANACRGSDDTAEGIARILEKRWGGTKP